MNAPHATTRQRGFSMLEILISLLITMLGLMGVAALQSQLHVAELEAYQRAQALLILSDITDRMNANRSTASCFAFTTNTANGTPYIGTDGGSHLGTPTCTVSTSAANQQTVDTINYLRDQLRGGAESLGGSNVGAMIGARACIHYDDTDLVSSRPGTGPYTIAVAWQGMNDTIDPSTATATAGWPTAARNCAQGLYGTDTKRRVIYTTIRIANLL